jgi:hypothetical protein
VLVGPEVRSKKTDGKQEDPYPVDPSC